MDKKEILKNNNFWFAYHIVDCEHEGDIASAENEVRNAGGTVLDSYWDGEDCGDAYVRVVCKTREEAEKIMEKLDGCAFLHKIKH